MLLSIAVIITVMCCVRGGSESSLETITPEFSEVTDSKSLHRALLIRPKNHSPVFSIRSILLLALLATAMIVVFMSDSGLESGGSIHRRRLRAVDLKLWCSACIARCSQNQSSDSQALTSGTSY